MRCRSFQAFVILVSLALAISGTVAADTYTITLDPAIAAAQPNPRSGRVILFFITHTGPRWDFRDPIEGPFYEAPQPIASIEVKDFKPGDAVKIAGSAIAFPDSLDKLRGIMRVQAIFDADQTERAHEQGPGNVYSDVLTIDVSPDTKEAVDLILKNMVKQPARTETANLRWIKHRSELLSQFYGRDVYHRAGVALPQGYNDPNWPRQQWPAIYLVPGFGDRDDGAADYTEMLADKKIETIAPIALYIVLDPEAPLGHHGFVDSQNNGPRQTALITEFIPFLESQFRLVAKPEARLITGHSSGGWSALWLQLNCPEIFGGCWASSPDPIDFSAFQMTDLYADLSMYTDADGRKTPSYRAFVDSFEQPTVLMTVEQEARMEFAIDPNGRSGQQWDAWEAMFSPKDPDTGLPRPLFDITTGRIDKSLARHWSKFDITHQLGIKWQRWAPIVNETVRLACGDTDSFFLNRAVERFKKAFQNLNGDQMPRGAGYVLMIENADHNITPQIFQRWNKEMREHLQKNGLQDRD